LGGKEKKTKGFYKPEKEGNFKRPAPVARWAHRAMASKLDN